MGALVPNSQVLQLDPDQQDGNSIYRDAPWLPFLQVTHVGNVSPARHNFLPLSDLIAIGFDPRIPKRSSNGGRSSGTALVSGTPAPPLLLRDRSPSWSRGWRSVASCG